MSNEKTIVNPLELIEVCKGHRVYIQTHNFPDPDAIGSALGLQKLFEHYGFQADICHEGSIDKLSSLKMLNLCGVKMNAYADILDQLTEEDYIVLVDCQKDNGNTTDIIGDEIAAVDHHPTVKQIEYKYSDLRITGACASIVSSYFKELGIEPDAKTATALLYGLRMDTLQFSRGVTDFDIEMFAFLFKYADQHLLTMLESNNMEFADLTAYGAAISNIEVFGTVGFSYLDFPCPDALVATLSDFILSLLEVEVAIVHAIRDTGYKYSIRSERDDVHAGELAGKALKGVGNGGGHATMAGGFAPSEKLMALSLDMHAASRDLFMEILRRDYPAALE